jgi:hypothetical protein
MTVRHDGVMNATLAGRQWGDGALADRSAHVIEKISYADDRIVCRCGAVITGIADESAWVAHGGRAMSIERVERAAVAADARENTDDSLEAMAVIAEMSERCTCTPGSDVRDCANYVADDDEPLDEGEETLQ